MFANPFQLKYEEIVAFSHESHIWYTQHSDALRPQTQPHLWMNTSIESQLGKMKETLMLPHSTTNQYPALVRTRQQVQCHCMSIQSITKVICISIRPIIKREMDDALPVTFTLYWAEWLSLHITHEEWGGLNFQLFLCILSMNRLRVMCFYWKNWWCFSTSSVHVFKYFFICQR